MTETVREVILGPMCALYPPPQHLRADHRALSLALAAYEKALAGFDRPTLERGWEEVVSTQTFWCWPNPGEIADACRKYQPHPRTPSEEETRQWQAMDMADTYFARYMKTSQVAKLARKEGWSGPLREYITDAAWVQAQLIVGVRHIGWNARLAREHGEFRSSAEAFDAYWETIREPVESGHVRVNVPRNRIREWKEQCDQEVQEPKVRAGRNAG